MQIFSPVLTHDVHWIHNDNKFHLLLRINLIDLANFNIANIWIILILSRIFSSSNRFSRICRILSKTLSKIAQSDEAVEFTNRISAEGQDSPTKWPNQLGLQNIPTASLQRDKISLKSGYLVWAVEYTDCISAKG